MVRKWTAEEEAELVATYASKSFNAEIGLDDLAARFGRHKTNVCRKARMLGLTDQKRRDKPQSEHVIRTRKYATDAELRAAISARTTAMIQQKGHPRGMAGKKHSAATKAAIAAASAHRWGVLSVAQQQEHTLKALAAKIEKYGQVAPNVKRGSWSAGWRDIGGKSKFYRSKWEANYARYLEWLKSVGQIAAWEHEPKTFWFDGIKRGCVSYLPDFRVIENNGREVFHEVKGWMDARSKTKIARMAKYHPSVTLIVIEARAYHEIRRKASALVPGWEE